MTTSSRCASFLSAMYYNTATAICNAAAYPHHRHPHQAVQKSACHALQCSDRELALCKQHCHKWNGCILYLANLQNKGSSGGHVMGLGVKLVLLGDLYVQIGTDNLSDTQAPDHASACECTTSHRLDSGREVSNARD
jgi:hypothetical protein